MDIMVCYYGFKLLCLTIIMVPMVFEARKDWQKIPLDNL